MKTTHASVKPPSKTRSIDFASPFLGKLGNAASFEELAGICARIAERMKTVSPNATISMLCPPVVRRAVTHQSIWSGGIFRPDPRTKEICSLVSDSEKFQSHVLFPICAVSEHIYRLCNGWYMRQTMPQKREIPSQCFGLYDGFYETLLSQNLIHAVIFASDWQSTPESRWLKANLPRWRIAAIELSPEESFLRAERTVTPHG